MTNNLRSRLRNGAGRENTRIRLGRRRGAASRSGSNSRLPKSSCSTVMIFRRRSMPRCTVSDVGPCATLRVSGRERKTKPHRQCRDRERSRGRVRKRETAALVPVRRHAKAALLLRPITPTSHGANATFSHFRHPIVLPQSRSVETERALVRSVK